MRVTTLLRRLLGVTQMYVKGVHLTPDGPLGVSVEPSWRRSRCGGCGNRAPRYDRRPVREWRHLSWGRAPALPRYAPWRVSCARCGVKVEREMAQRRWRRLNGARLLPLVRAGVKFVDGLPEARGKTETEARKEAA